MRRTAAQMTAPLPMALPRACRRLSKFERSLLCRAVDIAWGCLQTPLAAAEYVTLIEIQGKLNAALGVKSQFSDCEKRLLCRMIDVIWKRPVAPLRASDLTMLAGIQGRLEPRGGC